MPLVIPFLIFYLFLYWLYYLQGSLLYFGEAVSYEGLLRMLAGLSFATGPAPAPVSLTPYTPLFLLPLVLLGKLFRLDTFQESLILARVFQTTLLFFLFYFINQIRKIFFDDRPSSWDFLWAVLIVFSFGSIMVTALRPDTFSFLFEAFALFFVLKFLKTQDTKAPWISGLFFSFAFLVKFNTLGAFGGTILYFLFSKQKKGLAIIFASFLFFSALGLLCFYGVLGTSFTENILLSIQSRMWSFSEAIEVYKKVFDLFLIPLGFYFFLIFWGLQFIQWKEASRLLISVLLISFVFAFIGQLKWGAFHNYFLGVLYLGLIPASLAIYDLKNHSPQTTRFFLTAYLVLFMIRGLSVPSKIWKEARFFPELSKLQEEVKKKVPSGFIYTPDERIHLGFVQRTALGVLTEELFWTTPKLRPYWVTLKSSIENAGNHTAFIVPCSSLPPSGWGYSADKHPHRIQTGWYCLYF